MYKNLQDSADSNVKNINFDLRNKVSQRITRNGSDVHKYYRRKASSGTISCLSIARKAVEFDADEYQKFKYHRYVRKSYVPTPPRAPTSIWEQSQTFLINIGHSTVPTHNLLTNVVIQIL